jgi:hypothetical protein
MNPRIKIELLQAVTTVIHNNPQTLTRVGLICSAIPQSLFAGLIPDEEGYHKQFDSSSGLLGGCGSRDPTIGGPFLQEKPVWHMVLISVYAVSYNVSIPSSLALSQEFLTGPLDGQTIDKNLRHLDLR